MYLIYKFQILGIVINNGHWTNLSDSNLTYTSLNYANGPGGIRQVRKHNLTNAETGI